MTAWAEVFWGGPRTIAVDRFQSLIACKSKKGRLVATAEEDATFTAMN